MKVLALNCGSSSVKYQLWDIDKNIPLAKGQVDRIGLEDSNIDHKIDDKKISDSKKINNHDEAVKEIVDFLKDKSGILESLEEITGVGHRVVHGGTEFHESALIDTDILTKIKELSTLAPLHNPANIIGIESSQKVLPHAKHVAIFDTAFHQTMPEYVYTYAIPFEYQEKYGIRKYGFHGSSHKYVTEQACQYLNNKKANLITVHIGNGVSLTAIKDGKSFDTSIGLTPLEGVVMGTRSGSVDPAIVEFISDKAGMTIHEVLNMLNKGSGLSGLSKISSDHRDLIAGAKKGNKLAQLAMDIQDYSIKKQLGSYMAALGQVDAIVFTAGVGENSSETRKNICSNLDLFGIKIDEELNKQARGKFMEISTEDATVKVLVIPTNEELVMVKDTVKFLK